jgi:hypothetical protein
MLRTRKRAFFLDVAFPLRIMIEENNPQTGLSLGLSVRVSATDGFFLMKPPYLGSFTK